MNVARKTSFSAVTAAAKPELNGTVIRNAESNCALGKSTLVRAIRAAFFERYKSSSVEDLQPWGDSAAAPTVELEFEWQGKRWKLVKSFLKRKRCDVSVDGVAFSGEEAEEKLADLLGFEFPGRGASRPEHWGIPGLLWIEQGAGHEIHKPVEHAGSHLKSVLGSSLGEVTSSAGDALIARITKERARLLTATGRPTGDFATALEAHERLEREHADLQGRIRQYRQQVDRLGQLREEQARDEGERIWEAYRQQARAAEVRLAEVLGWQREQERDQQALQVCQASVRTSLDLLGRFEAQRKDLLDAIGADHKGGIPAALPIMAIQAAIRLGGFAAYQLALIVANAVARQVLGHGLRLAANAGLARVMGVLAGPIGLAITILWTILDIAGPAYRVTIPCVLQVAYMRQKNLVSTCPAEGCGAVNPRSAKFCQSCGHKLG